MVLVGGLPVKLLVQLVYCLMASHHYALGSVLMHFIFSMLVLVARIGGCAFIEHPAFPTWAAKLRPSSIWASKVARLLRRRERTQVLILDQCI